MSATAPSPVGGSAADAGAHAPDLLDTADAGVAAIRGGAMRLAGYAVAIPTSVLSSALLLRHLGVVAAGSYVTVLSLVSLAGGITDAGLAAIGTRELSVLSAPRHFYASLVGLRLAFLAVGIAFAILYAVLSGYSETLVLGTLIAGVGFLLGTMQSIYALPLLVRMRLQWVTVAEVLRQVGTAAAIVVLVLVGAPLLPFWASTIPAGVAATVLVAFPIRRSMSLLPVVDLKLWASLMRNALPYSLATAVGIIYFRLAILIMSHVSNGHQVGYYGASFRIIEVLFIVPQLLVGSSLPIFARAARDDRGRLDYALGRTFDVCLLLGVATGLLLLTGSPFIIAVLAGPKYVAADAVLRIQGVALIATFLGAVFSYGLLSLERYRVMLVTNLVVLLLSGVLTAVFGSAYGAVGAAAATAAVEILYTTMLAVALIRCGTRPAASLSSIPRVALVVTAAGALALLPSGLPDVLRPLIAMSVYCVGIFALRAVPEELIEQIPLARLRRSS